MRLRGFVGFASALAVLLSGCGVQTDIEESAGVDVGALTGDPCVTRVDCEDGDECTNDICNDGVCESIPWDTAHACSKGTCVAGVCMPPPAGNECVERTDCPEIECIVPTCDNGWCLYYAVSDYQSCGVGSVCLNGLCAVCQSNADCNDGNDCTDDVCIAGQCQSDRVENGEKCESTGACVAGLCCHGCALNGNACVSDCPTGMTCNQYKVCAP